MQLAWYSWLMGFGLTLAFEIPIVMWMLRDIERQWSRRLLVGICANLVTHPLVWFFFPQIPIGYPKTMAVSELWAFGVEACFYGYFASVPNARKAIVTSLLANGTSFSFGWFIVRRFAHCFF